MRRFPQPPVENLSRKCHVSVTVSDCESGGWFRLGPLPGCGRPCSRVTPCLTDPRPRGVLLVICPRELVGAGLASACWPDQKPVRRFCCGVSHHSPAAGGFEPRTDTDPFPPSKWR